MTGDIMMMLDVTATTAALAGTAIGHVRRAYGPSSASMAKVLVLATALGTSSALPSGGSPSRLFSDAATNAGQVVAASQAVHRGNATAAQITELKSITGLTWDQLAQMFGVDRRSVHYWAQRAAMNAANARNLNLVLAQVRQIFSQCDESVELVRSVLLSIGDDGRPLLDQIVEKCGGKLPPNAEAASSTKFVDLGVKRRPPLVPELSLSDRLASSTERIAPTTTPKPRRIQVKRKAKD